MSSVTYVTVDRDFVGPAILEEINATSVWGSDDVVWPSSIKIRIDWDVMDFMHPDGTALITMLEGDTGFHATRGYFLLLDRFIKNQEHVNDAVCLASHAACDARPGSQYEEIADTLAYCEGPKLE
jgi:hypothetical protein